MLLLLLALSTVIFHSTEAQRVGSHASRPLELNKPEIVAYSGRPLPDVLSLPWSIEQLGAILDDINIIEHKSRQSERRPCDSVCYEKLGCFDTCLGLLQHSMKLPANPSEMAVFFTHFSRRNLLKGRSFKYMSADGISRYFVERKKLYIISHGFGSSSEERWVNELKNSILKRVDANVIVVDWSRGAQVPFYCQSVANTELVGRQTAVVLHTLMKNNPWSVDPALVHFIGHSLAAQMGKFFSLYFKELSGGAVIGRITALDAARPLFEDYGVSLNRSDALFVDAIHTSAGIHILMGDFGVVNQIGHIDFYVNGGSKQPGCFFPQMSCNHARAHEYFITAVALPDCIFASFACAGGLGQYMKGECQVTPDSYNFISLDKTPLMPGRGEAVVEIEKTPPYCLRPKLKQRSRQYRSHSVAHGRNLFAHLG